MTVPGIRRVLVGSLLGSLALWGTLRDVDGAALAEALRRVDLVLAGASLAFTLAAVVVIAVRWKLLFQPDYGRIPTAALFRATVVGQMLNIAVPVRIGEVARLHRVISSFEVPAGRVLATLAIEKALEVAVFAASAITVAVLVAVPLEIVSPRSAWPAVPIVAFGVLWLTARYAPPLARRIARSRAVPEAARRRLVEFSDSFAVGVRQASSLGRVGQLLGLSAVAVLLPALANQLLLAAFGLHLPIWAGLALLIVLQVGSVPPSLPGRLGIFNYLTVVTLVWMGVDRVTAASYSIALYAIAYLPKLVLGALFLALPEPRAVRVAPEPVP